MVATSPGIAIGTRTIRTTYRGILEGSYNGPFGVKADRTVTWGSLVSKVIYALGKAEAEKKGRILEVWLVGSEPGG